MEPTKEPLTTSERDFLDEAGKTSSEDRSAARELALEKSDTGQKTAEGHALVTVKDEKTGEVSEMPVTQIAQTENILPPMEDPGYKQASEDNWRTQEKESQVNPTPAPTDPNADPNNPTS